MASLDIKISSENLLKWSSMEDWENGTSSAPTEHTLSGTGATIAREATTIKTGTYSAAVTRNSNDATLYYDLPEYADYQKRKVTFGCWVYATVASRGRIGISDGVKATSTSSYHSGGSGWEFLEVTHDVDESATRLRVEMHVNTGDTTVYFDNGILVEGDKTYNLLSSSADIAKYTQALRYRSQKFNVARRVGNVIPNNKPDSQSISLEGLVVGSTITTARTTYDTIVKDINSTRIKPNGDTEPKDLYLYDDRLLKVHINSFSSKPEQTFKNISFTMRCTAPDPTYQYIQMLRSATTIDSSPKTATVTTNGSTNTRCIITATAGSADITALTIENFTTDQIFTYSGTITSGNSLIIDTDLLTVENNGADDVANVSNEIGLLLVPGDNEFEYTITGGSTDSTVKIDWYDRWL
jgi:hypothetical protein